MGGSVQFDSPSQYMRRTTSVPQGSACTICAWIKITSYEDWLDVFSVSRNAGNFFGLECDGGGNAYLHTGSDAGYESITLSTGSYTGWWFVAGVFDTTGLQAYYHKVGGSWTAPTKIADHPPSGTGTATSFGWAYEDVFGGSNNGTVRLAYMRAWTVALTQTELQAERDSPTVVKTSNCTFSNAGNDAANVQVDGTGTANMTKTGTPTDQSDGPPLAQSLAPGVQALSLTQQAPTLEAAAGGTTLEPGVQSLTLTQEAPTVVWDADLAPGVQSMSLTQLAPTVAPGAIAVSPGAQSLALNQLAPTVALGGISLSPSALSFTLTQLAPSLGQASTLSPGVQTLTITLQAPSLYAASRLHWKVHSSGRYIVNDYDEPVLVHGDSPWCAIDQLTQTEAQQYLQDAATRHFNALVIAAPNIGFTDNPPENVFGDLPWTGTAFQSSLNAAYWNHVKWFFQQANARGIVPLFNPAYLGINNTEGWQDQVAAASNGQMQTYGTDVATYLVDCDYVIVAYGDNGGSPTHQARLAAMLSGMMSVGRPRLLSFHNGPDSPSWETSATDITTLHFAYVYEESDGGYTHVQVREGYQQSTVKPVVMFESRYENPGVVDEERVRRQAWGAVAYGACGQCYGHELQWKFENDWADYLDDPVRVQLIYLQRFFNARQWWLLEPDFNATSTFITAGRGTEADPGFVPGAVASDGSWGFAYIPDGSGPITIDRTELSDTFTARWYNPRAGTYTAIGTSPNTGTEQFTRPDANDWVLVLDVDVPLELGMPSSLSLSLTQQAPVIAFTQTLSPSAQAITMTQQAPALAAGGITVSPSAQVLTLNQQAPVLLPGPISVAFGSALGLSLDQLAPALALGGITLSPAALALALSQLAPTLRNSGVLAPDILDLALDQHDPSLAFGGITVAVDDVLAIGLDQQAPVIGIEGPVLAMPAALAIALSELAPSLGFGNITLGMVAQVLSLDLPEPAVVLLLLDLGLPAPLALALSQLSPTVVNGSLIRGDITGGDFVLVRPAQGGDLR